jgi:hypothetical protein
VHVVGFAVELVELGADGAHGDRGCW